MPLTSLERHAAFAAAAQLAGVGRVKAAEDMGATWTHVKRVLTDPSQGGAELNAKIDAFIATAAVLGRKIGRRARAAA